MIISSIPPCRVLALRLWALFQGHSANSEHEPSGGQSYWNIRSFASKLTSASGKTSTLRHHSKRDNAQTLRWEPLGDPRNNTSDSMELPLYDSPRAATEGRKEDIMKTSDFAVTAEEGQPGAKKPRFSGDRV